MLMALVCLISIMNIYSRAAEKIMELRTAAEASAMLPGSEGRITLSVPFTFTPFYLPEGVASRTIICTASVHSWNGRSEEESYEGAASSSEYVYVTDNESVYHTSAGCTHLDLSIHAAPGSAVQSMKKLGFTSLTLYHWSGGSWETVMTVTDQYLTNTDYFFYTTTRTGLSSGHVYRVIVELYAKKGFLQTQTISLTSDNMVCR